MPILKRLTRTKILLLNFCILLILLRCPENNENMRWGKFIKTFITKYQEAQLSDIYKITFQATFGPGHLGSNIDDIKYSIEKEISEIEEDCNASLYEPIENDSEFIWINLKKFKCENFDPEILAKAILLSSKNVGNQALFDKRWPEVGNLIKRGELNFSINDFKNFTQKIKRENYPIIHHSERFIKVYDPHYRVVKFSIWKELISRY